MDRCVVPAGAGSHRTRHGAPTCVTIAVHAFVGAWLSLVEHSVRDRGVGGSNPLAPTIFGARRSALRADFTPSPRLSSLHYARASPARSIAVARNPRIGNVRLGLNRA